MSVQPTKEQQRIFNDLKKYLHERRKVKHSHYTGTHDDSCAFGRKPIRCYIQYVSSRAYKRPKCSVMVVVKENAKNQKEIFEKSNYMYGTKTRHVFVKPDDRLSLERAKKLIDTIIR